MKTIKILFLVSMVGLSIEKVNSRNTIPASGNIGIGTKSPQSELEVKGAAQLERVRVSDSAYYEGPVVMEDCVKVESKLTDERLLGIAPNSKLPNMPSAKDVAENGIAVGDLEVKLVEKVEELTLYVIHLEQSMKALEEKYIQLLEETNEK